MTEILTVISGVFTFWSQVTWLVKLLQKTPAENQADLITKLQAEADSYAKTGRPIWGG